MEVREAIAYRKSLIEKAMAGQKLTENQREWLASNPIYNDKIGDSFLNLDILRISPQTEYLVHIKLLSNLKGEYGIPLVGIPWGQGCVQAAGTVRDLNGKEFTRKKVKLLGIEIDDFHRQTTLRIRSALGLLSVAYIYEYRMEESRAVVRKSSSTGDLRYAMRRTAENGVYMYECKQPSNDNMKALVFSLELQPAGSVQPT